MDKLIKQAEELRKKAAELLETAEELRKKAAEKLEKKVKSENLPIPKIGESIEIAGMKWIILDKTEKGYLALAAESLAEKIFGSSNDWRESDIRKYLNVEIAGLLENALNVELPEFERDLLSLDGQTEYGTCMDKVSLLTVDEYRKYRKYIPNAGYWWWTCTPDSTKCNRDTMWIRVVSSGGDVGSDVCNYYFGVRPFCIFPSSLFESEKGE